MIASPTPSVFIAATTGAADRSVTCGFASTSGDQGRLAVYGARRTGDGAVTVAVVNKSAADLRAPLDVHGVTAVGPAQVWQWTDRTILKAGRSGGDPHRDHRPGPFDDAARRPDADHAGP